MMMMAVMLLPLLLSEKNKGEDRQTMDDVCDNALYTTIRTLFARSSSGSSSSICSTIITQTDWTLREIALHSLLWLRAAAAAAAVMYLLST